MTTTERKVLVTGATGFIGSRLVQWLCQVEGVRVVAFVRNFARASRISRFPVELRRGDVCDATSLQAASRDCDGIVHAAVTFAGSPAENRRVTLEGAENVCRTAQANHVRRAVYLSTISVYGDVPVGPLTEETACQPADAYGRDKLDAEGVFASAGRGELSCVTLRLPVVYGPWSFWSTYAMEQLGRGRVILPNDGRGLCNAMYVDDAVRAIVAAWQAPLSTTAATCLVSGPEPITWQRYYEGHGRAAGRPATIEGLPTAELIQRLKTAARPNAVRRLWNLRDEYRVVMRVPGIPWVNRRLKALVRRVQPAPPPAVSGAAALHEVLPNPSHVGLMASTSVIDATRAGELLGFRPATSFDEGIERIAAWRQWLQPHGDDSAN